MSTYRLIVQGRVQGVWYRKYTLAYAKELDIKGFVRNLGDGSVEVVANIDSKEKIEKLIESLYKGSPFSKVEDVTCKQIDSQEFQEFEQR